MVPPAVSIRRESIAASAKRLVGIYQEEEDDKGHRPRRRISSVLLLKVILEKIAVWTAAPQAIASSGFDGLV